MTTNSEDDIVVEEKKELVANRRSPGDRWNPVGNESLTLDSLTELLEYVYQETGKTTFFLDAREGTVHTVTIEKRSVKPSPPKKWNLYGE